MFHDFEKGWGFVDSRGRYERYLKCTSHSLAHKRLELSFAMQFTG